jgi:hypothetical protein
MTTEQPEMWDGTRLGGSAVALVVFAEGGPPAVAAASNGRSSRVVPPDRLGPFLRVHEGVPLLCHGAGELHRVLHDHLGGAADAGARQALWDSVRAGRLYDVRLLDQLARLAERGSSRPRPRTLAELVSQDAPEAAAEGAGTDQLPGGATPTARAHTDPALVAEAVRSASAVWKVAVALGQQLRAAGLDSAAGFGTLSLALQVQGDVALAHARYNGLGLAPQALQKIMDRCLAARQRAGATLLRDKGARSWLKIDTRGQVRFRPNGLPDTRPRALETWLRGLFDSLKGLHLTDFNPPFKDDGRPSMDPEDWGVLTRCHPHLRAWADIMTAPAIGRACAAASTGPLLPRYEVLPRLRSRDPDLEEVRRFGGPDLFQPAPGHRFLVIELKDLNLRALAAVCRRRGSSVLSELFARGQEPDEYTAGALGPVAPGAPPAPQATHRPADDWWATVARALLTAAPLGLSVEGVREIAHAEYGLDISLAELARLHGRLTEEVLPELGLYLQDDTWEVLANNLGTTPKEVLDRLRFSFPEVPSPAQLRQWFRGDRTLDRPVEDHLRGLLLMCQGKRFWPPLEGRRFDRDLYLLLFGRDVTTLTGRKRGRVLFGEARSAEYQDLADDAAKSALFAIASAGYRLVAFAANTILVEIEDSSDVEAQAARAEVLARAAVEKVLPGIPVACRTRVQHRW